MIRLATILLVLLLNACASTTQPQKITLPLLVGWYEASAVHYITTDVSNAAMAAKMQANYAPRLRDAIPVYPKAPQAKTVIERVYAFPDGEQSRNVFASIPQPVGANSQDQHYSPIWLMYKVEWIDKNNSRELRSEGDILAAEAQGLVSVARTDIVVNCPIVSIDGQ
ncbi:DUF7482 domain-containing protein [Eionea flava]